ncbi:NAD(P)/FAD-dependent oxidoreductase [Rhodococcus sp. ANT_H53B]|uniref:NAD(P)/FAD-dependent oxidoreductase n=1 Tax=Rhodococcus sp. ANT_H53B TaxID=2597357 RepID=UPI0011EFE699|nr:FAD-dependent oxidoreductase [Rhodococcus sp. ANT_H53B]KAA0923546.1 FAD-dependent oxidoreductase [Rhodococcus sp. ANT_H53B]
MTTGQPAEVVIVGTGATGYTAAKVLRAEGFTGSITLIGSEQEATYRRPAVSKELLMGTKSVDQVRLGAAIEGVDVRTGVTAVAVTDSAVHLDEGDPIPYDAVLLATGSRARQLDFPGHVFTLRSATDVAPLHADILRTGSLLVIGGGLIGCESAAAARSLGAEVTVLEAASAPLSRIAPPKISQMYRDLHADNGITMHTDVTVTSLDEQDDGTLRATARDGRSWSAGTVLVSAGSVPNVELGADMGLETASGILVDASMRTSRPNVYAAGDVAEVPNTILGGTYRSEHWNGAVDQATRAARSILGLDVGSLDVPWGWSTQHGLNLQFAGWTGAEDEYVVVRGSIEERRFTACALRGDTLVGAIGVGFPKDIRQIRSLIASADPIDRELLGEDWLDRPHAVVR